MDWSSLGGIALALVGIFVGQSIEGGHVSSLIQPAAFFNLISGTFGAVLLQNNLKEVIASLLMLREVFVTPADDRKDLAKRKRTIYQKRPFTHGRWHAAGKNP